MSTLETQGGRLHRAVIPGLGGGGEPADAVLDAITLSNGEVVAVYLAADLAIELHDIPNLIHALQCALQPYGGDPEPHDSGSSDG